jgi:hypothetical protein
VRLAFMPGVSGDWMPGTRLERLICAFLIERSTSRAWYLWVGEVEG